MSDFVQLRGNMNQEVIQTLLEMRKLARSLENGLESLIPLLRSPLIQQKFTDGANDCARIARQMQDLYNRNAKAAFAQEVPDVPRQGRPTILQTGGGSSRTGDLLPESSDQESTGSNGSPVQEGIQESKEG